MGAAGDWIVPVAPNAAIFTWMPVPWGSFGTVLRHPRGRCGGSFPHLGTGDGKSETVSDFVITCALTRHPRLIEVQIPGRAARGTKSATTGHRSSASEAGNPESWR